MLVSRRDIFDLILNVINWIGSKSSERQKYLRRNESEQRRANYNYQYEPAVANHLMFREFFLLNVV